MVVEICREAKSLNDDQSLNNDHSPAKMADRDEPTSQEPDIKEGQVCSYGELI